MGSNILCDIKDNTRVRVDMEFLIEYLTWYLTSERRERLR